MTEPIILKFVCADLEEARKIGASVADYLKTPVVIETGDGKRHHLIPMETGEFLTRIEGDPGFKSRGPADVDEDFKFPGYSEYGG